MKALLQSALEVALCVVRANPDVLEGLGACLEGNYVTANLVSLSLSYLIMLTSFDLWML